MVVIVVVAVLAVVVVIAAGMVAVVYVRMHVCGYVCTCGYTFACARVCVCVFMSLYIHKKQIHLHNSELINALSAWKTQLTEWFCGCVRRGRRCRRGLRDCCGYGGQCQHASISSGRECKGRVCVCVCVCVCDHGRDYVAVNASKT